MAMFFAVVLGIAGLCVYSVNYQVKRDDVKRQPPPLDHNVAEGFRLWDPKAGVDSVSFESCRVEKMRMGFFALGGFNVLCIKGLVLNLPLEEGMSEEERGKSEEGREKRVEGRAKGEEGRAKGEEGREKSEEGREKGEEGSGKREEPFAGLLPKSLMERTGLIAKRFSGIRVDGLQVNRVVNRSLVPVFAAKTMKNRGKSLELTNCRVFADDGATNLVAKAMLRLKPVPVLVWNGGERRLDDLLK